MTKQIFPGGQTQQMRDQKEKCQREYRAQQQAAKVREKEMKRERKEKEKAAKQEFLKKIGPSTRLLMARRGFTAFIAAMMLEIGVGTGVFMIRNTTRPETDRRSYTEALKNAYNITNLADGDKWIRKESDFVSDAIETLFATLLILVAAEYARRNMKRDQLTAKRTANLSPFFNMSDLYYIKNDIHHVPVKKEITWKLHPISRQIIKHIAANNPTLFNELISGKVSYVSRDYAITVIETHLKSHPEDFKKVLEVYKEESLPKSLTRKYGQRVR